MLCNSLCKSENGNVKLNGWGLSNIFEFKGSRELMKSINYFYCINRRFQPDNELVVSAPEEKMPNFIDLTSTQKISPCCLYKMFRGKKSDSLVCSQVLYVLNIYMRDDRQLSKDALTEFLENLLMQVLSKSNHKVSLNFSIT